MVGAGQTPFIIRFPQTKPGQPRPPSIKTEEGELFIKNAQAACLTDRRLPPGDPSAGAPYLFRRPSPRRLRDVLSRPRPAARFEAPADFEGFLFSEPDSRPAFRPGSGRAGWQLEVGPQGLGLLASWAEQDPESFKAGAAFLLEWVSLLRQVPSARPPPEFISALASDPLAGDPSDPEVQRMAWKKATRSAFEEILVAFSMDGARIDRASVRSGAAALLFYCVLAEGPHSLERSPSLSLAVRFARSWARWHDGASGLAEGGPGPLGEDMVGDILGLIRDVFWLSEGEAVRN